MIKKWFLLIVLVFMSWLMLATRTSAQGDAGDSSDAITPNEIIAEVVVEDVYNSQVTPIDEAQKQVKQELKVLITNGERKGERLVIEQQRVMGVAEVEYKVGDKLMVSINNVNGEEFYYVVDYVRRDVLFRLFLVFVILVLLVSGKNGFQSLTGLVASFGLIFYVILPGMQKGYDPILIALMGAGLIIIVTFYLTHGFNEKTTWAVLGTVIALAVTAVLTQVVMLAAKINGFGSEEAMFLQVVKSGKLNLYGLYLAGVIIGALGVLDDITISQSSVVKEIKRANPKLKTQELFARAMNVGRDHIASLVNTLILVYTGSALPLLLLFMLDPSRSFSTVINYSMVAEEVVRVLTGSIGIVLAVPFTTFLAAKWGFSKTELKEEKKVPKGKLLA